MDRNGNCTKCIKKCNHSIHYNQPYIILIVSRIIKRHSDELKIKIQNNKQNLSKF
jgi:hypothetical protein